MGNHTSSLHQLRHNQAISLEEFQPGSQSEITVTATLSHALTSTLTGADDAVNSLSPNIDGIKCPWVDRTQKTKSIAVFTIPIETLGYEVCEPRQVSTLFGPLDKAQVKRLASYGADDATNEACRSDVTAAERDRTLEEDDFSHTLKGVKVTDKQLENNASLNSQEHHIASSESNCASTEHARTNPQQKNSCHGHVSAGHMFAKATSAAHPKDACSIHNKSEIAKNEDTDNNTHMESDPFERSTLKTGKARHSSDTRWEAQEPSNTEQDGIVQRFDSILPTEILTTQSNLDRQRKDRPAGRKVTVPALAREPYKDPSQVEALISCRAPKGVQATPSGSKGPIIVALPTVLSREPYVDPDKLAQKISCRPKIVEQMKSFKERSTPVLVSLPAALSSEPYVDPVKIADIISCRQVVKPNSPSRSTTVSSPGAHRSTKQKMVIQLVGRKIKKSLSCEEIPLLSRSTTKECKSAVVGHDGEELHKAGVKDSHSTESKGSYIAVADRESVTEKELKQNDQSKDNSNDYHQLEDRVLRGDRVVNEVSSRAPCEDTVRDYDNIVYDWQIGPNVADKMHARRNELLEMENVCSRDELVEEWLALLLAREVRDGPSNNTFVSQDTNLAEKNTCTPTKTHQRRLSQFTSDALAFTLRFCKSKVQDLTDGVLGKSSTKLKGNAPPNVRDRLPLHVSANSGTKETESAVCTTHTATDEVNEWLNAVPARTPNIDQSVRAQQHVHTDDAALWETVLPKEISTLTPCRSRRFSSQKVCHADSSTNIPMGTDIISSTSEVHSTAALTPPRCAKNTNMSYPRVYDTAAVTPPRGYRRAYMTPAQLHRMVTSTQTFPRDPDSFTESLVPSGQKYTWHKIPQRTQQEPSGHPSLPRTQSMWMMKNHNTIDCPPTNTIDDGKLVNSLQCENQNNIVCRSTISPEHTSPLRKVVLPHRCEKPQGFSTQDLAVTGTTSLPAMCGLLVGDTIVKVISTLFK